jgi:hypothetical protein
MITTQTTIRARNARKTKPSASVEPQGEKQYLYCIVDISTEPVPSAGDGCADDKVTHEVPQGADKQARQQFLGNDGGQAGSNVGLPVGAVEPSKKVDSGHQTFPDASNAEVGAVEHEGIAALVSTTVLDKLEISRGNAIAHQRVMEAAMQRGHTVLPVRFNTIAEPKPGQTARQRIIDHVLVGRRDEIRGLMTTMKPLVEMGVKGLWTDMEAVFRDIVSASAEIQSCRKKLLGAPGRKGQANVTMQIKLGEMVKKALEARKLQAQNALLERLKPLAVDFRVNKTFGDPMFANLAILIDKSRQDEVADVLSAFEARQGCPSKLRYVGPLPPCNFLELVITWED